MASRRRKIVWILVGVVVAVVGAVVIVALNPEFFVRIAIEAAVSHVLGLDTDVESVHLDRHSGEFRLRGLVVANPEEGYLTPYFLSLGALEASIDPRSLGSDVIEVKSVALKDIDLYLEQGLMHSNVLSAAGNLKGMGGRKKKPKKQGKRFHIGDVRVQDITAEVHLTSRALRKTFVSFVVEVPELAVQDVTPENAKPLLLQEVMEKVLPAVLEPVVEKAREVMSQDGAVDIDKREREMIEKMLDLSLRYLRGDKWEPPAGSPLGTGTIPPDILKDLLQSDDE